MSCLLRMLLACAGAMCLLFGHAHAQRNPLPLPSDPEQDCGRMTFHNFTRENPACSKQFYHREDTDEVCCEALAQWYGPQSAKPSRNCFCHKDTWETFKTVIEDTHFAFDTALYMCTYKSYPVAFYQEDDNGTATGMCTGAPANMTELATVCNDNCPLKPRASLADWTGRLAQEPLVWASLVTGVMSSVGALLMLLPILVDGCCSILQVACSPTNLKRSRSSNTIMHIPGK